MTSAPAIGFECRPSRWLGRLLLFASSLAVVAAWLSASPWPAKLLATIAVAVALRQTSVRWSSMPLAAAGWARDGSWTLQMPVGEDVSATLASFRVVGEQVIWLRWTLPGRRHVALLLAPDNSDSDIRRRLRMRLAQVEAAGHSGR
jgi:toxin CptA